MAADDLGDHRLAFLKGWSGRSLLAGLFWWRKTSSSKSPGGKDGGKLAHANVMLRAQQVGHTVKT